MKYVIPGHYVKIFGRALHCLDKIGDELYIEGIKDGLTLRTINSSRSAYACFEFSRDFFVVCEDGQSKSGSQSSEFMKCRISMKSCISVFKSLSTMDKIVELCRIELNLDECRLVFTLCCKHGVIKTHSLGYRESESLHAVYSKELCPNQFIVQPRLMVESVGNFHASCDEITLTAHPQNIKIRNFIEDELEAVKVTHTELTLSPIEFENFQIGVDSEITFCLKEFRSILSFSEFVNQTICAYFENAGKPIVFSLNDQLFKMDLVLSSLSEKNMDNTQISQNVTNRNVNTTKNNSIAPNNLSKAQKDLPQKNGLASRTGNAVHTDLAGKSNDEITVPNLLADDDLDNAEDFLAGTPPIKRHKKSLFDMSVVNKTVIAEPLALTEVLAADTDDEEE